MANNGTGDGLMYFVSAARPCSAGQTRLWLTERREYGLEAPLGSIFDYSVVRELTVAVSGMLTGGRVFGNPR
jgi:hypothetical protein